MKTRLDVYLVEHGYLDSRQKAQAVVMSGQVYVDGRRVDKPGAPVAEGAAVEVRGSALRYVSRGGLKLEKAMGLWPITLEGKVCMDIGASTGGFTDCMLQNGAAAFASVDVSFISLKLILPAVAGLLREGGQAVCLVKPQFEAGREKVGKKGVVRDPAVHREVLEHFLDHAHLSGFKVLELSFSPIRGPEGNIEYLGWLEKGAWEEKTFDLAGLVEASHGELA